MAARIKKPVPTAPQAAPAEPKTPEVSQKAPPDPRVPTPKMAEKPGSDEALADIRAVQARKAAAVTPPAVPAASAAPVVKHVWTSEDTYADLAFKHYGSIKEPYWRLIYNHNKAIIGDHPNNIRVGLEIEIPPLPEELKKK